MTTSERDAKGIALWWNATLSSFRKRHNLTIDELARMLPAKTQLVADWENGKQHPPLFLKRALRELDQELKSAVPKQSGHTQGSLKIN
jgi:DNA-binding transcriptional regulator YiaG